MMEAEGGDDSDVAAAHGDDDPVLAAEQTDGGTRQRQQRRRRRPPPLLDQQEAEAGQGDRGSGGQRDQQGGHMATELARKKIARGDEGDGEHRQQLRD